MQHLPREKYETDDKFSAPVIGVTFSLRQFFSSTFDLQSSIISFTTKNLFIIKKIDRLSCISVCVSVSSLVCCSKILLVTIEKLRNLLDGTKACFLKSIIREYIHLSWEIIFLVKKKIAYFSKLFTKKKCYIERRNRSFCFHKLKYQPSLLPWKQQIEQLTFNWFLTSLH